MLSQKNKVYVTKIELLLAVAMGSFYETTHVIFIPKGKRGLNAITTRLRATRDIEAIGEKFYRLTKKGRAYIVRYKDTHYKEQDAEIDKFVDGL